MREEKWFPLFLIPLQGMRPLIEARAGPGKMMRRLRLTETPEFRLYCQIRVDIEPP
jgi:hypothetical protein